MAEQTSRPFMLLELLEALDRYEISGGDEGLIVTRWRGQGAGGGGNDDHEATAVFRELIVRELRGYGAEAIGEIVLAKLAEVGAT